MKKILQWNPEFAKNIWLELSPIRLISMPAIIILIVGLIFMNSASSSDAIKYIHNISLGGFIIIGLLWGMKSASDSILDEFNEKTWDWQKTSSMGPWKLAFGKLFGSTIYNWYGSLICFAVFMFSIADDANTGIEIRKGFLMIISMISLHGLMILMALQMVRKNTGRNKIKSNRLFITGFLFIGFSSSILSNNIFLGKTIIDIAWYGIPMNYSEIAIISGLFYCFWIIAGLYRSMRAELQFSDAPVWWIVFIISNFIFQYGFFISNQSMPGAISLAACLGLSMIQSLFIVYFLALNESKNIVNFRQLLTCIKQKEYNTLFQNIPLWLITLPIAFIFGLLAALVFMIVPLSSSGYNMFNELHLQNRFELILILMAIFGFVIRDLGVLLLLNFSSRSKRADATMIVYLFLIYSILPMLTKDMGVASIFYPYQKSGYLLMVSFPIMEAIIVLYFLRKKLKEMDNILMKA